MLLFQRSFERWTYWILSSLWPKTLICLCCDYERDIYDNLDAIAEEMKKRNLPFYWIFSNQKKWNKIFLNIFNLARSRIIILDTSNRLWAQLPLSRRTEVIYCGHGGGAYKKMGWAALKNNNYKGHLKMERRRFDWVVSTSPYIQNFVCENYHINSNQVLSFGLPRTDSFMMMNWDLVKKKFLKKNPKLYGKKIITFAPTFRNLKGERRSNFSFEIKIPDGYAFVYRAHPTVTKAVSLPSNWVDASSDSQLEVMAITDILVTDYSSLLFDFAYFCKPIVLYVPDEMEYRLEERDLWHSPIELVGKQNVCRDAAELELALFSPGPEQAIWQRFMCSCDGFASRRIVDFALNRLN